MFFQQTLALRAQRLSFEVCGRYCKSSLRFLVPSALWSTLLTVKNFQIEFELQRLDSTSVDVDKRTDCAAVFVRAGKSGILCKEWKMANIELLVIVLSHFSQGNNLTTLDRNAFGKVPVLFELDLSNNAINNVSTRSFEGLLQLIHLKMNNNNISVIPNGAFQGKSTSRCLCCISEYCVFYRIFYGIPLEKNSSKTRTKLSNFM